MIDRRRYAAERRKRRNAYEVLGDGIVRESVPGAAKLTSLSTANYFTSATGAGGPDLLPGNTIALKWWSDNPTTDSFAWGYTDGSSGWSIDINGSNVYVYLRNPGTLALVITGQGWIYGLNSVVITRTAGGAIRASLNGSTVVAVSASPTYVQVPAGGLEYVGRSHPTIGSYTAAKVPLIDWGWLNREASDAELSEWSRTDMADCWHLHSSLVADAALQHRICAEDWDGSSSTITPRVGTRTLTKAGSPVRTAIAARTRYTIPAWAYQDGPQTVTAASRFFAERVRLSTDATELSIQLDDGLGASSPSYVAYKGAGIRVGAAADGSGGTWLDNLNAFGASGYPVTVEASGLGAGAKDIDLLEGLRIQTGTGPYTSIGYTLSKVSVPATTALTFARKTAPANRLLLVTDSLGEQVVQTGSIVTQQAWSAICRVNRGAVTVDAVGSSSYYSRAYQSAWRAASVAKWVALLDGTSTNTVLVALGTNDYGINPWATNLDNFEACVAATFDDLHAAAPSAVVYMMLPPTRTTEGTIEDWRTRMRTVASTRAWINVIETIDAARAADGLHWTIAGHVTVEAAIRTVLGY